MQENNDNDRNGMSPERLAQIRQLYEATTAGPWKSYLEDREKMSGSSFIRTGGEDLYLTGATDADQDFIASAHQDIPDLLAEVERLQLLLSEFTSPPVLQKLELKPGKLNSSVSIYLPDTVAYVYVGPEESRLKPCSGVTCEGGGFSLDCSPSNFDLLGVELIYYETIVEGGWRPRPEADSGILVVVPTPERILGPLTAILYLKSGLLEIIFSPNSVEKYVRLGDHLYVGLNSNMELLQMLIYVSSSDIKTGPKTIWPNWPT